MTEELKQIIEEELKKLPKSRQDAIASVGWEKIAEEIGGKYSFFDHDLTNLQAEIFLVLIGAENMDSFALNVAYNVVKPKEVAEKIANEVEEKVFIPAAKDMEERIKMEARKTDSSWHQNVEFILSGGDYSALLKKPEESPRNKIAADQKI